MYRKRKKKLTKLGRRLFYLLLLFSLVLSVVCLYNLYSHYKSYEEGEKTYSEISLSNEENVTVESKYDSLKKINKDYIGWLTLEGTVIDYPIVQGSDNEYYLEHLFDGKENHMGCIFIDYENKNTFEDKNTFLYGHHTNTGSMFCILENYKDQNFYNNHKEFTLETENKKYKIKPFAGILVKGNESFIQLSFESNDSFMDYVRKIRKQSIFESPVTVKPSDKLVTMVTCTDDFYDARLALFCVLEEENML